MKRILTLPPAPSPFNHTQTQKVLLCYQPCVISLVIISCLDGKEPELAEDDHMQEERTVEGATAAPVPQTSVNPATG